MQKLCATLQAPDGTQVVMRVGLHCGPLVGGVVGGSMLRYHLFGSPMDAVTQVRTLRQRTIKPQTIFLFLQSRP